MVRFFLRGSVASARAAILPGPLRIFQGTLAFQETVKYFGVPLLNCAIPAQIFAATCYCNETNLRFEPSNRVPPRQLKPDHVIFPPGYEDRTEICSAHCCTLRTNRKTLPYWYHLCTTISAEAHLGLLWGRSSLRNCCTFTESRALARAFAYTA